MNSELLLQLLDGLAPFVFLLIVILGVFSLIRLIADIRTRDRLIEKGLLDDRLQSLFQREAKLQALVTLRWAMVLISVGLATIVTTLIGYSLTDPLFYGITILIVGIALAGYFFLLQMLLLATGASLFKSDNPASSFPNE